MAGPAAHAKGQGRCVPQCVAWGQNRTSEGRFVLSEMDSTIGGGCQGLCPWCGLGQYLQQLCKFLG
jgi:hypothetical protein